MFDPPVRCTLGAMTKPTPPLHGAELVGGTFAFASFIANAIGGWFKDVWSSLTSKGGIDEMQRMDAALAIAELVMLTILADGAVSPTELYALQVHYDSRRLHEDARAALDVYAQRASSVATDPAQLTALARATGARIPEEHRFDALVAVANVARHMQSVEHARELAHSNADRATVVRRIGAALGLDAAACDRALAQ